MTSLTGGVSLTEGVSLTVAQLKLLGITSNKVWEKHRKLLGHKDGESFEDFFVRKHGYASNKHKEEISSNKMNLSIESRLTELENLVKKINGWVNTNWEGRRKIEGEFPIVQNMASNNWIDIQDIKKRMTKLEKSSIVASPKLKETLLKNKP